VLLVFLLQLIHVGISKLICLEFLTDIIVFDSFLNYCDLKKKEREREREHSTKKQQPDLICDQQNNHYSITLKSSPRTFQEK